jgi:hypothetical protein
MHWSRHKAALEKTFKSGGTIHDRLPHSRQLMIKKAFGIIPNTVRHRIGTDAKTDQPLFKESLDPNVIPIRENLDGCIDLLRYKIGATKSQVIHALVSDRLDKLADGVLLRLRNARRKMVRKDDEGKPIAFYVIDPDVVEKGHIWGEKDPMQISHENVVEAISEQFNICFGVMTEHEKEAAAKSAAAAASRVEATEAGKRGTANKRGVKVAIEKVNKRQAHRAKAAAGV